jgi:Fe2+ or Zn2+ uptake regulation protein
MKATEKIKNNSKILEERNIRPSIVRLAVFDYLIEHKTHPTADEIFYNLSKTIPTLSKTTIYNVLNLFVCSGIAKALTIDDKQIRFDGNITPHAHFRCRKCGKIFDFPMPFIRETNIVNKNFEIETTQIYYIGLCDNCKK